MNEVIQKLHITDKEGWFSITHKTLAHHGAGGILTRYDGSVSKLLAHVFPEYKQACRETVQNMVNELKLSKVEDLLHVPIEYS